MVDAHTHTYSITSVHLILYKHDPNPYPTLTLLMNGTLVFPPKLHQLFISVIFLHNIYPQEIASQIIQTFLTFIRMSL